MPSLEEEAPIYFQEILSEHGEGKSGRIRPLISATSLIKPCHRDYLSKYIKLSGGANNKGSLKQGAIWSYVSLVAEDMLLVFPLLVWSAVIGREQCSSDSANLKDAQSCLRGMIVPAALIKSFGLILVCTAFKLKINKQPSHVPQSYCSWFIHHFSKMSMNLVSSVLSVALLQTEKDLFSRNLLPKGPTWPSFEICCSGSKK